jgi:hypothetical protein
LCLLIDPNASIGLILSLVLRAVNVPTIKKNPFRKRKVFVTVSNAETTAKTTDAPVEGQTANWDQNLDPLYAFPLSLRFYA